MAKERIELLNENGYILLNKYNGKVINILEEGNFEISKILKILSNLDPWKDIYSNCIFMKRAQLFLAMVYGNLQNKSNLKGIEEMTLYADYEIPKILEDLGILKYNEELKNKINNRQLIESKSEEEISIRAFTIYVGELISNKIGCPSPYLDYILWSLGVKNSKPHHYTKTIWY